MSGRGGIYEGPGGNELYGDGREVTDHNPASAPRYQLFRQKPKDVEPKLVLSTNSLAVAVDQAKRITQNDWVYVFDSEAK